VLTSSRELKFGIGDFDCHKRIDRQYISKYEDQISQSELVCLDGNIPADSIKYAVEVCSQKGVPVWFEPTDIVHTGKPFETDCWKHLTYVSPNLEELRHMVGHLTGSRHFNTGAMPAEMPLEVAVKESVELCKQLIKFIPNILVTLGKHGVVLARRTADVEVPFPTRSFPVSKDRETANRDLMSAVHYAAVPPSKLVSVSGAGDCMAATIVAGIVQRHSPDVAVRRGLLAAALSLQSFDAVPDTITSELTAMSRDALVKTVDVTSTVVSP
jgi:sugar/nucleoside kinase (ribokinase family)